MPQPWEQQLDAAVERLEPRLREIRRHLHQHPEPSGEEYQTTAYLRQALESDSVRAHSLPSGRGLIAEAAERDTPGPWIALRGDIDALRIQDLKEVAYRSRREGVMHACGHDGHATVALGAILALEELRRAGDLPWELRARALFQPAEESALGAREMMAAGALEGVTGIFSLHMDPSRPVGRIGIRYGPLTAACDSVEIRLDGRGGHAARPHQAADPLGAAAQLVNLLYTALPRSNDVHEPVVFTLGEFHAGHSPNVIPETAVLRGTLRTMDRLVRRQTRRTIARLCEGLGETLGVEITVLFEEGPPSVDNSREHADILSIAAMGVVGAHAVDLIPRPSMGGEDFAYYLDHVPGAMFRLGSARVPEGDPPLHSPHFDLDERALAIGARVLARAVVLAADPSRAGG